MEFHFSGSARDMDLDGGQTTALHPQVELFVSLAYSVALKTCHGSASAGGGLKATANEAKGERTDRTLLSSATTSAASRDGAATSRFAHLRTGFKGSRRSKAKTLAHEAFRLLRGTSFGHCDVTSPKVVEV
jgi:hypothetical protein